MSQTCQILLSRGFVALIDIEDYEKVSRFKWWAQVVHNKNGSVKVYAAYVDSRRKKHYMHRLILNVKNKMHVDHIDNDGLNNRRANLRIATPEQNAANVSAKSGKNRTSKYRGVSWNKNAGKWVAQARSNGSGYLGLFESEESAYKAYKQAVCNIRGNFAPKEYS